MGAYLSAPVTEKRSQDSSGAGLTYGLSDMQGWRRSMEDAHVATCNLDGNLSMFAVFDGHGGTEVSKFCAKHMPEVIQHMPAYKKGELGSSLTEVFHKMDDMLRDQQFFEEVQRLRNSEDVREEDTDPNSKDSSRMDLLQKLLSLKRLVDTDGNKPGGPPMELDAMGNPTCRLADHEIQAGCTAVVCLLSEEQIIVANAGDSRGVLCRAGQAVALSHDHKPNQDRERNRIVSAGGFVTDMHGQHRVNGNLNLSRAIGDLKYKSIKELPAAEQIITAEPDLVVQQRDKEQDEFVVLACDGVWDCMTNQECCDFVRERLPNAKSVSEVTEQLLDHCLASDPKEAHGIGCDNMTAIIIKFTK
jgi:protein phosphatase 1G